MGCAQPAVSILLIAPQDQQAWLVGPDHEAARDGVPLCASHADRVTVPFGWQLRDDRPTAKPRTRRKSRARKAKAEPQPANTAARDAPEPSVEPAAASRRGAAVEPADPAPPPVESAEPSPAVSATPAPGDAATPETTEDARSETPAGPAETTAAPAAGPPIEAAGSPRDAGSGSAADAAPPGPEDRRSPADVPVHAEDVASGLAGSGARLTVVPGDDDPSKTFAVEADGQTALWAESPREDHEPSDETPLLKRAFRVVRED